MPSSRGFQNREARDVWLYQSQPSLARPVSQTLEKEQILATLDKVNWHRGKAAGLLGITPKTLYRKLRSYDIGKN